MWRKGEYRELEQRLRSNRPEPSSEFLRRMSRHWSGDRAGAPRRRVRLAFAGALTIVVLMATAGFGGIGYAAAAAGGAAEAVSEAVQPQSTPAEPANATPASASSSSQAVSAAQKQYGTPICHRTGSNSNPYVLIVVDERALAAHRRHPPINGRNDIIPAPATGCPTS